MEASSTLGTIILLITGLVTYKGFMDTRYYERYLFHVDKILIDKEYDRLFTSGFLHGGWIHFGFNMIALIGFSLSLEITFGYPKFILIYVASLLGGSLLALFIHRNHGDYRAVGASGAISGVVLSSIVLFPESSISFIILPFSMKSWIFGLLFIVISIFGIKAKKGNIGHEAHLGGAITGVLITLLLQPSLLKTNWWIVLMILLPVTAFLILIVRNPAVLLVDKYWGEQVKGLSDWKKKPPKTKRSKEKQLNYLLDKIRKSGIESLSKKEKADLDELKNEL